MRRSRSLREYTTRIVCLSEQQMDTADSEQDIIQMGTERVGDDSKRTANISSTSTAVSSRASRIPSTTCSK